MNEQQQDPDNVAKPSPPPSESAKGAPSEPSELDKAQAEYSRLCGIRGDIEAKLLQWEERNTELESHKVSLLQQRDANTGNLKKLFQKVSKIQGSQEKPIA